MINFKKNRCKGFKEIAIFLLILIFNAQVIFNSQAAILHPEGTGDLVRLIVSKFNHTLAPKALTHTMERIEKAIEAKGGKTFSAYKIYKKRFRKYVYPSIGHSSWIAGTHLPFIGTDALNIPAIASYTISQVVTNRLLTDEANYRSTFDLSIKGGAILSVYFEDEQLVIEESINSKVKGFLRENNPITYSKERGAFYVHLNESPLKLHDDEANWFGLAYRSLKKNVDESNIRFLKVIENESDELVKKISVNHQGKIIKEALWPRMFERVFPDYRPTLDIKLIDGTMISIFFKKNKMTVGESIHSSKKDFITAIEKDNGDLIIRVDKAKLGIIDPEISDSFRVGINSNDEFKKMFKRLTQIGNVASNSDIIDNVYIEGINGKSPVIETFVNAHGLTTFWNKFNPYTKYFNLQLDGITSQSTSFADAMQRFTRILVTANISWPMFEIGRQFYSSGGIFNISPILTHSYGLFSSFIVGGITGAALGSRFIDIGYLMNHNLRKFYFNNISSKLPNRAFSKISNKSCASLFAEVVKSGPKQKLTLDLARKYLIENWGMKYKIASTSLGIIFGGFGAYASPQLYKKGKNYLVNLFFDNEDKDLENLKQGAEFNRDYKIYKEGQEKTLPDSFFKNLNQKEIVTAEIVEKTFSSFSLGGENDLEIFKRGSVDELPVNVLKNRYKVNFLKTINGYKDDPEALRDFYFMAYLLVQPVKDLQEKYLKKVQNVKNIGELEELLNNYILDARLEKYRQLSRSSIFHNADNSFEKIVKKMISFISMSDAIIYDRFLNEVSAK